uniref:Uncharacterized protein n=1 Tax=Otus sunia TaxID=257818 RepID=A0A8C8AG40_9STRI
NGTALVPKSFSHVSLCYFVSAVSVVVALCCFSALLYGIYSCCSDEAPDRAWLSVALGVAIIILFFLLVSACILRVGMDALCASLVQTRTVTSCQEAEHKPWGSYRPTRFYRNLYSAQVTPKHPPDPPKNTWGLLGERGAAIPQPLQRAGDPQTPP